MVLIYLLLYRRIICEKRRTTEMRWLQGDGSIWRFGLIKHRNWDVQYRIWIKCLNLKKRYNQITHHKSHELSVLDQNRVVGDGQDREEHINGRGVKFWTNMYGKWKNKWDQGSCMSIIKRCPVQIYFWDVFLLQNNQEISCFELICVNGFFFYYQQEMVETPCLLRLFA